MGVHSFMDSFTFEIESERTLETLKRTTQGGTIEVQMLEGCTLYQGA